MACEAYFQIVKIVASAESLEYVHSSVRTSGACISPLQGANLVYISFACMERLGVRRSRSRDIRSAMHRLR